MVEDSNKLIYNFDTKTSLNNIDNIEIDSDEFDEFSLEFEDYDLLIKNLRNIIEEIPIGMQAKFAKLINILMQKKNIFKQIVKIENEIDFEDAYEKLYNSIKKDLEFNFESKNKFDSIIKVVKLREFITELRKDKLNKMKIGKK